MCSPSTLRPAECTGRRAALKDPSRDRDDAPKFGARRTQKEERCAGVPVARGLTADGSAVVPLLCPVTHRSLSDFPHTFDSPLAQIWSIDSFVRPIGDSLSHMTSTAPCTRINRPVAAGARAKAPCGVSEHGLHSTCVFMDCMLAFSAHAVSLITSCSADSGRGSRPGRHDRLRTFHPRPLLTHGRAHCGHRC